jgi:hypothetical protein
MISKLMFSRLIPYESLRNKAIFGRDLNPGQIMNTAVTGKRLSIPGSIPGFV